MSTNLSTDQINAFREEGYLIVPGLFDAEEARILHAAAKADQAFEDHAYDLEDGEGGKAQLVLWNKAGEDLWGSIARCERIVNAMEQLLEEVSFTAPDLKGQKISVTPEYIKTRIFLYIVKNNCRTTM